ncbi:MAG TPA: methyltransferase domain-containing protein [bacterium]|nr:methyltransferase domain-containing protein [bacterium]
MQLRKAILLILYFLISGQLCSAAAQQNEHTRESALSFWKVANSSLLPVYAPLAEQIVNDYNLSGEKGLGIDLGSGPGNLIIELCKRTGKMEWINADINPHFFPIFLKEAEEAGIRQRIKAIFADAEDLPFEDNYAEIIVSRGSFQFWKNRQLAFSEIYRVLKPGGVAFIGRGFSENLPVETARKIRLNGNLPAYDITDITDELRKIMQNLKIDNYTIKIPKPPGSEGINYGIWLEFQKPGTPAEGGVGKIQGNIIDSGSNQPLPDVNVVIEKTKLGAAADKHGRFTIINVPPGTYSLKASRVGYASQIKKNVKVYAGKTTIEDISLTVSAIKGEEVMISALRSRNIISNPVIESLGLEPATTVITKSDIEKQGAKTVIDALKYVPGAWVETRGRKVKQFFSVRGQKYPYPEYAIDGTWQREFHELKKTV